jgi:hypothetical protein
MKYNGKEKMRTCDHCGEAFEGKRSDAKYCGSNCRQYAFQYKISQTRNLAERTDSILLDQEDKLELAQLMDQYYGHDNDDSMVEFRHRINAIDRISEHFDLVLRELEFRNKHNVSYGEYHYVRTHISSIVFWDDEVTEADLNVFRELENNGFVCEDHFGIESHIPGFRGISSSVNDLFLSDILGQ